MNTAQVIVILVGVLAYLILMGCSLAFLTSCRRRSADEDVTWRPAGRDGGR